MNAANKIDRLLALSERKRVIEEVATHTREANVQILAAIDALGDIDANGSSAGGALRGSLPEIKRALYVLRRMVGDVNRGIANVGRAK